MKVFCLYYIAALLITVANGQCLGREPLLPTGLSPGWAGFDSSVPFDFGFGGPGIGFNTFAPPNGLAASYGGGLTVTSSSPIAPTGLTVTSENTIEGTLSLTGQLPFLGAVSAEGKFPSVGVGSVTYGCGDGVIGITAENPVIPLASGYGNLGAPYNSRGYGPVY
ncbi:chorion class CB protein M5H4-like [Bombyx mandarina]|uniref:Chorion class CB protein M5H4-like n=1 Tax=Bombyx mandarina TaxID=7092 RepID=A0A6J2KHU3_BOMMA|nr:chorion class CB protein M5H4-like [Bombyx mandarina]